MRKALFIAVALLLAGIISVSFNLIMRYQEQAEKTELSESVNNSPLQKESQAEEPTTVLATAQSETTTAESTTQELITQELITTVTTTKSETTTVVITASADTGEKTNLGSFQITCYTPYSDGGVWGYQTSTGARSTHLKTCAVDPSVIPMGSIIYINGLELKAVDVGSAVKGKHIDIFYDGTDREAKNWIEGFGDRADVYI